MLPLVSVWPYALLFWAAFVWAYLPEFFLNRRSRQFRETQDAGSFAVVLIVQSIALMAAFIIGFVHRFGVLQQRYLWFWIGLGALIAGSLLRRHCFRMLGKSFTAVVVVSPGQAVIDRGIYRWVRHPSYTGGLVMQTGIGLCLGNWISTVVIFVVVLASYIYRVRVEEKALLETLGEPYRDYMQRTKRFVPLLI